MEETPTPTTVKLSKVVCCEIKGTLNGFSMMGPEAASWKPMDGKHASIFGSDDQHIGGGMDDPSAMMLSSDLSAATGSLRNATITKATLLQSHNTFPVPLGVIVSCLPRREVVETGDKYTFTTVPNASVTYPYVLYEAGAAQQEAKQWQTLYPNFNSSNLETQDVLNIQNCPYVFVHENHPVVNLLRMNKAKLGVDIDTIQKMDNQWFKITRPLMQESCDSLRTKVLNRICPSTDLTKMGVQLCRLGGAEWSQVDDADALMTFAPAPTWDKEQLKAGLKAHRSNFMERPATFMARIQLDYEIQQV
jgi:hypothetical protein